MRRTALSTAQTAVRACVPCTTRQQPLRLFSASSRWTADDKEDAGPSKQSDSWPLDDNDVVEVDAAQSNPYAGLLNGEDAFTTVDAPNPRRHPSPSWISEQLDSLSAPPTSSRPSSSAELNRRRNWGKPEDVDATGRRKNLVPRSVLFADSNAKRSSKSDSSYLRTDNEMGTNERQASTHNRRKDYDRSPLTQQEANAFMSLLNQALGGPSPSSSSTSPASASPFGSYTSMLSDSSTETGSKNLLEAFVRRNRLQRFEESRAARAKKFAREGLAAKISHAELEAGIDEAREDISLCANLADLIAFAKREVWGIAPDETGTEPHQPKYGRETPFYSSVLHLLFLTIRDRYRAPNTALSVPRITKLLGVESYVLGMTSTLYNDMLKTQWDWLGDMQGVVETLKQARSTGILGSGSLSARRAARRADRADRVADPSGYTSAASFSHGSNEDEAIRDTVDRITNEVRKHALDQVVATPSPVIQHETPHSPTNTPIMSLLDAKSGTPQHDQRPTSSTSAEKPASLADNASLNWAQRIVLDQAQQATILAGQPTRVLSTNPSSARRKSGSFRPKYGNSDHSRSTELRY